MSNSIFLFILFCKFFLFSLSIVLKLLFRLPCSSYIKASPLFPLALEFLKTKLSPCSVSTIVSRLSTSIFFDFFLKSERGLSKKSSCIKSILLNKELYSSAFSSCILATFLLLLFSYFSLSLDSSLLAVANSWTIGYIEFLYPSSIEFILSVISFIFWSTLSFAILACKDLTSSIVLFICLAISSYFSNGVLSKSLL